MKKITDYITIILIGTVILTVIKALLLHFCHIELNALASIIVMGAYYLPVHYFTDIKKNTKYTHRNLDTFHTIELTEANGNYLLTETTTDGVRFGKQITKERYLYLSELLSADKNSSAS